MRGGRLQVSALETSLGLDKNNAVMTGSGSEWLRVVADLVYLHTCWPGEGWGGAGGGGRCGRAYLWAWLEQHWCAAY